LSYWTSQVPSQGRSGVLEAFIAPGEFSADMQALYDTGQSDTQRTDTFVGDFYKSCLNRDPTSSELQTQEINTASASGESAVVSAVISMGASLKSRFTVNMHI
jgi:hypothetical protein